ncbi:5-dehydro-4-deoxy-D-glucuronate isomerase [Ereboglobus luteus]|uniref:5-dehydro-4-deoxy-D-glucuronate isomerase n=1 Tax=Ereboglobus luteus TaxID=1796921 RepID=A0A2U8E297_9BACT|nr:5-dehydro-4-deoxy-D-glucuronate isomerase [Ereboglobus luteus]AWI08961.1 5-dehydro-4-deoxy-D-glucuronate isomerase [Ereboglobus luteus]
MKLHYSASPDTTNSMTTEQLRDTYLIQSIFQPGQIIAHYTDLDRMVVVGVQPAGAPLKLGNYKEIGSSYFLERREIGILNITKTPGTVTVGGNKYELGHLDCLYIGLGEQDVTFSGDTQFYCISTPAHMKYPTAVLRGEDIKTPPIGDPVNANKRVIRRYIHQLEGGIKSCQLVMGCTTLETGSVWNTMPSHVHSRRTEVYLYFDVPQDQMVVHLMGEPNRTRNIMVQDRDVVLSPGWSIHSGCGTAAYRFVWAMGGDNQKFEDMDAVEIKDMR